MLCMVWWVGFLPHGCTVLRFALWHGLENHVPYRAQAVEMECRPEPRTEFYGLGGSDISYTKNKQLRASSPEQRGDGMGARGLGFDRLRGDRERVYCKSGFHMLDRSGIVPTNAICCYNEILNRMEGKKKRNKKNDRSGKRRLEWESFHQLIRPMLYESLNDLDVFSQLPGVSAIFQQVRSVLLGDQVHHPQAGDLCSRAIGSIAVQSLQIFFDLADQVYAGFDNDADLKPSASERFEAAQIQTGEDLRQQKSVGGRGVVLQDSNVAGENGGVDLDQTVMACDDENHDWNVHLEKIR